MRIDYVHMSLNTLIRTYPRGSASHAHTKNWHHAHINTYVKMCVLCILTLLLYCYTCTYPSSASEYIHDIYFLPTIQPQKTRNSNAHQHASVTAYLYVNVLLAQNHTKNENAYLVTSKKYNKICEITDNRCS